MQKDSSKANRGQRSPATKAMPTLKDIAAACGVSAMTVSDVLNGKSKAASIQTRERILATAKELEYRPNAVARSLRRRRTNIIGFYGGYGYVPNRSLFAAEIAAGLQDGCEDNKQDLLIHGTFRGRSVEDIYTELNSGQIDGLVILAPPDDPLAARLAGSPLSVVAIADAVPGIPSVTADDAWAGQLLASYLHRQGHRHILYYTSGRIQVSAARRLAAFCDKSLQLGMEVPVIIPVDWQGGVIGERPDAPFFALSACLAPIKGIPPTAAVCWNDTTAYKLMTECDKLAVRIPQDLAVVGYDGIAPQIKPDRVLTSVRLPWAHTAQKAVSLVVSLIDGEEVPMETVFPVEMLLGETG